ncbi:kinase-like protein [Fomitiporia mediterranea MF3/22]|uniref:kinase-like protein n=1 Tax=Fomitiporia mediterranea (strain MF3/22) TaxID=694068 RepID=UPI0004408BA4|nr:kinase-like protein [Fomitiporia mediterranea MF3/22]EJD07979.1 kinase-like protein [Fomitiporia mediterranea MF3/22]
MYKKAKLMRRASLQRVCLEFGTNSPSIRILLHAIVESRVLLMADVRPTQTQLTVTGCQLDRRISKRVAGSSHASVSLFTLQADNQSLQTSILQGPYGLRRGAVMSTPSQQALVLPRIDKLKAIKLNDGVKGELRALLETENLCLNVLPPPHESQKVPVGKGKSSFIFLVDHAGIKETGVQGKLAAKLIPRYTFPGGGSLNSKQQKHTKEFAQKEAKYLMELSHEHPHILYCYGLFVNPVYWVILTEYAEQGDVFNYYTGYRATHNDNCPAERFIHRDIKSENMLRTSKATPDFTSLQGITVLGDFGFMVKKDSKGKAEGFVGSTGFYAPELLLNSNKPYSDKVDMWAIGVITYTFLAKCNFLNDVRYFLDKEKTLFTNACIQIQLKEFLQEEHFFTQKKSL